MLLLWLVKVFWFVMWYVLDFSIVLLLPGVFLLEFHMSNILSISFWSHTVL